MMIIGVGEIGQRRQIQIQLMFGISVQRKRVGRKLHQLGPALSKNQVFLFRKLTTQFVLALVSIECERKPERGQKKSFCLQTIE